MKKYILYIPTSLNEDLYQFDRVLPGGLFTVNLEKAGEVTSAHFDDVLGRGTPEEVFRHYKEVIIETNGIQETLKANNPELPIKLMSGSKIVDLVYPTYKSPLERQGFKKSQDKDGQKTFYREGSFGPEIIRIKDEVVIATQYEKAIDDLRALPLTLEELEAIVKEIKFQ